ncbi:rhomboid family intramembrane serine protease [Teredinibacter sp. KSP-S5-2]|uniref:rhomboid family intramembrane serine protease n=1 Tax=Teredinibacter sp. KSP-S5-2 TaxID=3034506 RepID=UPI0029347FFC|nr:rhomboid family intramembrane serine protease [Teredinibacter sp. KSP-S5-2]WNO11130.1 rhomboid family intramembrane serine protease [Teredinibacter sp. KSP-S5-2]
MPSYYENSKQIVGTLSLGILVMGLFWFMTDFTFLKTNHTLYTLLCLSIHKELLTYLPLQLISHSFVHFDISHLASNVYLLALLSVYERRVGTKRFLAVFIVACIAATPSVLFYPSGTAAAGMSGGVMGLLAGYFTDDEKMDFKEWSVALATLSLVSMFLTFRSISHEELSSSMEAIGKIDHIGHALGAIGAVIYCRFISAKKKQTVKEHNIPSSPGAEPKQMASNAQATPSSIIDTHPIQTKVANKPLVQSNTQGQASEDINDLVPELSPPLLKAMERHQENGNEHQLKEAVLNMFFRLEHRLNNNRENKLNYKEVIDLLEQTELAMHVPLFRKILL